MPLKATFIGINEYTDLALDNLEGARLDATALHSLFCDSCPGIDAHLLVDRAATRAAVDAALRAVLGTAGPDDTVIITFAGHGAADLGLILHDSSTLDPTSMVSMSELASHFQNTSARNVLVLLDCCESGEGPRRVLSSWPDSHELDRALHSADGGGRVMIAAANPLQSALESSVVKGHGLLTASLIDVLSDAVAPVDVRVLAASVAERVRAEAARIGEEQNTVDVSVVAGGFFLPPLRQGPAYRAAFPDRSGVVVSKDFLELEALGIPREVAQVWAAAYPGLNELQLQAVNECRLLDGENLLVVAPTSSGKTLLGEMAALRAVGSGRRAVFLVPYRALAAEQMETFSLRYGSATGLRVIRCTGDHSDDVSQFVRGKYDIAVLTYEMFLSIVLGSPTALSHVGTVVLDEAHFIADPERGITVELLLTLLVAERKRGTAPQVVALSAVIGKVNHFDEWLGARCLSHTKRPVPLVEGVIDRTGRYQYVDVDGAHKLAQLVPAQEVRQRGMKPSAQDLIVPLAKVILMDASETLLVFRGVKGNSAGCANYLAAELVLAPATQALKSLPAVPASSDSTRLRGCLERGTAFHNANLVREEKAAVERAFRDARELRVLAATTTLAAGVNTPATTVIVVEHEFPGKPPRPFTVAEYKNMAGRAGRPGFAPVGRSILYAETSIERELLFRTYVLGQPEGVRSSFSSEATDTWLIRLLRQVRRIEPDKVAGLLANTFGGYTIARRDPAWAARMERDVSARLARMRTLGLVEDYRGKIALTRLGEACGQSSLSLNSCMHLVEMLKTNPGIDARELMALVQCLDEAAAVYTPLKPTKAGKDRGWDRALVSTIRRSVLRELARGGEDEDHERRCKRTALLLDWIGAVPMARLEERFSTNLYVAMTLGTVQGIANVTRFHLRSAAEIARVLFGNDAMGEQQVAELLEQLERGLTLALCEVARLVPAMMREELVALEQGGVGSASAIAHATDDILLGALRDPARVKLLRDAGLRPPSAVEASAASSP